MATITADPSVLHSFTRHALEPALSLCAALVDKGGLLPVLSTVCATWQGQALTLAATNLRVTIRQVVSLPQPCAGDTKEEVLLPLQSVLGILKLLDEHAPFTMEIDLSLNKRNPSQLVIAEGGTTWRLPLTFSVDDFPAIPTPPADCPSGAVASDALQTLCALASHGAIKRPDPQDEQTASLLHRMQGVHFAADGDTLTALATDNHHCLRKGIGYRGDAFACCLPLDAAPLAVRWLSQQAGHLITLAVDDSRIWFLNAANWFCAQKLSVAPLDTTHLLPTPEEQPDSAILCNREALMLALRCCQVAADGKPAQVTIRPESNGDLSMQRYDKTGAGGQVVVRLSTCQNPEAWMARQVDGVKLLRTLSHFTSDRVQLWQRAHHPALCVSGQDNIDAQTQYMLMPFAEKDA